MLEPPAPLVLDPDAMPPDPSVADSRVAAELVSYLPPELLADGRVVCLVYAGAYDADRSYSRQAVIAYGNALWRINRPGFAPPPFVSTSPDELPPWNTRDWSLVYMVGRDPTTGQAHSCVCWCGPPTDAWATDPRRVGSDAWLDWNGPLLTIFGDLHQRFGTPVDAADVIAPGTPPAPPTP